MAGAKLASTIQLQGHGTLPASIRRAPPPFNAPHFWVVIFSVSMCLCPLSTSPPGHLKAGSNLRSRLLSTVACTQQVGALMTTWHQDTLFAFLLVTCARAGDSWAVLLWSLRSAAC